MDRFPPPIILTLTDDLHKNTSIDNYKDKFFIGAQRWSECFDALPPHRRFTNMTVADEGYENFMWCGRPVCPLVGAE